MNIELNDKSREGFTFHKGLHFFKLIISKKFTEVLDAYYKFEDINFVKLKQLGIKGIILDIDECVAPHHGEILPENFEVIKQMLSTGLKLVVFSNMKKTLRYKKLEQLGVKVITSKYAKPDPRGFLECLETLGMNCNEVVMIGDNYLTDGGCRSAGIEFIKVRPIVSDYSHGVSRKVQIISRTFIDFLAQNFHGTLEYAESTVD